MRLCYVRLAYFLRICTIKLYYKKFHNILECIQDSDCTGNSDTCVKGQCQCGTNPGVCKHAAICINGDCVKKQGNENDTELFDRFFQRR